MYLACQMASALSRVAMMIFPVGRDNAAAFSGKRA
jgi:hypothetical protein